MVPKIFPSAWQHQVNTLTAVGDLLPQMSLRWNYGVEQLDGLRDGRTCRMAELNTFPVRFPRGALHTLCARYATGNARNSYCSCVWRSGRDRSGDEPKSQLRPKGFGIRIA